MPEMFAFPKLEDIYSKIIKSSGAIVKFGITVIDIKRTNQGVLVTDNNGETEKYDELVLACDAETSLKLLGREASFMERKVLGNVRYFNDVTVTHEDVAYMKKYYDVDETRNDQYFVRIDPQDPEKIDMSFNLSNYQTQLLEKKDRQIWQTIFLDDSRRHLWSMEEIDKDTILLERWWRQMAHTWRHFAFTVPFVRFIQGHRRTWFAGSYTLFNTHEMAVMSGFAAAVRLGAEYPFTDDKFATNQFDQYLKYSHGFKR